MVGIILASHGTFAEGIYESAEMIFGEQENVQTVILKRSEGPDDVHAKMEKAIASFSDPEQVLFLVDLWGGTPFNQASKVYEEHKDTWAIVAGMNLPMVIEAYASRMSMDTAQEIAAHILETAKDGIKVKPEDLQPKEEETVPKAQDGQPKGGSLPEGTVIGDGKIKYVLARVDSRLLHGQVATSWTKSTAPNRIIVVSDTVAHDNLRKSMIMQAAPPGVKANVIPISKMQEVANHPRFGNTKALILFENPEDALKSIQGGMDLHELNIGSMSHSTGKVAVNNVLSMGPQDVKAFDELKKMGVKFDLRKVPGDKRGNFDELVEKARKELGL
ncbi:mannose/fructose/sorbose-specific PTS system IIAB component [Ligilactobacillus salitolerans]|uniref:PTS system mannose-specific EIIAB component n=1 Tax=Ligilactobacillus salitolerans TaxID=1808352 RepID=A0A401IV03_9LACO|nr:mannose/fructose/sorbose PTS transporter subunit IIA [Ligilactobacillus salitolerans]GBG95346.1 mannose/fructose/sorbose-specific PTS system IIAB component [Ligilactobacillus salitolerans]